jgi:hypothetical protein
MMNATFVVGTRYFESKPENVGASLAKLGKLIDGMLAAGAMKVYVAVNVAEDKSNAVSQTWPEKAVVFPVMPWGQFVIPLNNIMTEAREDLAGGAKLVLASVEISADAKTVNTLLKYLTKRTIVVGAALMGHQFEPGIHKQATGRQTPWNTLAAWNPDFLWNTGFPMIGDGPIGEVQNRGVEEVATIGLLQKLYPYTAAKLVQVEGQNWDTSIFDADRLAKHEAKMASKDTRPARQLEVSHFKAPTVIHI